MAAMTFTTRRKLVEACDLALALLKIGYAPAEVISDLISHCSARHGYYASGNQFYLRIATVEVATASMSERDLLWRWISRAQAVLGDAERLAA